MEENIVTIDVSKLLGNAPSQDSQSRAFLESHSLQVELALLAALAKPAKKQWHSRAVGALSKRLRLMKLSLILLSNRLFH